MITNWGIPYHAVFGVTDADRHDHSLAAYLPRPRRKNTGNLAALRRRLAQAERDTAELAAAVAELERRARR